MDCHITQGHWLGVIDTQNSTGNLQTRVRDEFNEKKNKHCYTAEGIMIPSQSNASPKKQKKKQKQKTNRWISNFPN